MNPPDKERASAGGALCSRLLAAIAVIFAAFALALYAEEPLGWWVSRGAVNSGATQNDNAVANEGQLKQFTVQAANEMNANLSGFGAGNSLNTLVEDWNEQYFANGGTGPLPQDFTVVNVGQLKYIGAMVWSQLQAAGYTGTAGLPSWLVVNPANDPHAAVLGQLKTIFNFDLTYSSDGSPLPDWWVTHYFGGLIVSGTTIDPNAYVAWSGSQVTILQAYQNGWGPIDYYNGQAPTLTIVSGSGQTGSPGCLLPAPLAVRVTDTNGNPCNGAPVTFTITSGSGALQDLVTSATAGTMLEFADSTGQVQVKFQLPLVQGTSSQITASTGTAASAVSLTSTEFSGDGILAIVSGTGQVGTSGSFVTSPLVVSVASANGNPIANTPVTFTVTSGSGQLQASSTGASATSLTLSANSTGQAHAYFQLPPILSNTSQITVTTGTGQQVLFSEASDSGTGSYFSPFAPINVVGSMNLDGSETITWQNNDNSSPIYIYQLQSSGTWTVVATLSPGTTSYTASPSMLGSIQLGNNYTTGGSSGGGGGGGGGGGPGIPLPYNPNNAVPTNPTMQVPASATCAYVIIDLGAGNQPLGINDAGEILYISSTNQNNYVSWTNGVPTVLGSNACFGPLQNGMIYQTGSSVQVDGTYICGNWYDYGKTFLSSGGIYSQGEFDNVGDPDSFVPLAGFGDATLGELYLDATEEALSSGTDSETAYGYDGVYQAGYGYGMVNDNGTFTYFGYAGYDGYAGGWDYIGCGTWGADVWGSTSAGTYGTFDYWSYNFPSSYPDNPPFITGGTSSGFSPSLIPIEVNEEGFMTATDTEDGYIMASSGATPQEVAPNGVLAGLTDSSLGKGEGPYYLVTPNGSSVSTMLYCYNGGNPIGINLNGVASGGGGGVSGRAVSNHLVIPMYGQVWLNGCARPLTSLCSSGTSTWSNLSATGIAPGTDAMIGTATYSGTDPTIATGSHGALLIPVQISVTFDYAGSGWDPSQSALFDPEAIISAKAALPPGLSGSFNIIQDCSSTLTQTYDNSSWAYCSTPGFLADDGTDVDVENWTDSQGNLNATRTDSPVEGLRGLAEYLTKIEDTGTFRDFVTLQIGSNPPQLVGEVDWSFSTSAVFTADPRTTGTNHYPTVHQPPDTIETAPAVGQITHGGKPTNQPIPPPRSPTANDYIGSEGNWNLYDP